MVSKRLIERLQSAKNAACALYDQPFDTPAFRRWARRTGRVLEEIFGPDSRPVREFTQSVSLLQEQERTSEDTGEIGALQDWLVERIHELCRRYTSNLQPAGRSQ
jgi:hypothetical protein